MACSHQACFRLSQPHKRKYSYQSVATYPTMPEIL
jgi:hypothetical protein